LICIKEKRPPTEGGLRIPINRRGFVSTRVGPAFLYFFMPESCRFFLYSARSAALAWPNMSGAAATVVVAAAAVAFGFVVFFAKAPEVETARIARPTRTSFFMLGSRDWKNGRHGFPNWRRLVEFHKSARKKPRSAGLVQTGDPSDEMPD
jgi:hypothetical protein